MSEQWERERERERKLRKGAKGLPYMTSASKMPQICWQIVPTFFGQRGPKNPTFLWTLYLESPKAKGKRQKLRIAMRLQRRGAPVTNCVCRRVETRVCQRTADFRDWEWQGTIFHWRADYLSNIMQKFIKKESFLDLDYLFRVSVRCRAWTNKPFRWRFGGLFSDFTGDPN